MADFLEAGQVLGTGGHLIAKLARHTGQYAHVQSEYIGGCKYWSLVSCILPGVSEGATCCLHSFLTGVHLVAQLNG